MTTRVENTPRQLAAAGLFTGIGGIELGLQKAGHEAVLLAENYPAAAHVLRTHFPDAKLEPDARSLVRLPDDVDLLTAGFPCQDLSSVGPKIGIEGTKSSLVGVVFELLAKHPVPWVVLENVPFILDLGRGRALRLITSALDELGYRWAYRVVDSEAFGLPQRRRRWFLVAALEDDPRTVLLSDDAARPTSVTHWADVACGFYWTEGTRALGWAVNAVPPIKCGSSVGVASPPAIILPGGELVTPDIRDAERLQGFRADWTKPTEDVERPSYRWRLVGNAVSVKVSEWLGTRLRTPRRYEDANDLPLEPGQRWPRRRGQWGRELSCHRLPTRPCGVGAPASLTSSSIRPSRCRRGLPAGSCHELSKGTSGSLMASWIWSRSMSAGTAEL